MIGTAVRPCSCLLLRRPDERASGDLRDGRRQHAHAVGAEHLVAVSLQVHHGITSRSRIDGEELLEEHVARIERCRHLVDRDPDLRLPVVQLPECRGGAAVLGHLAAMQVDGAEARHAENGFLEHVGAGDDAQVGLELLEGENASGIVKVDDVQM